MSTVLVVDDDLDIRTMMARELSRDGYEVHMACDGEDAVGAILRFRPDLVVLDWNMPNMDGLEVCRLIRSAEDGVGVPVIVVTGRAQPEDAIRCFAAGADGYLTKPFTSEQLSGRVRYVLDGASRR